MLVPANPVDQNRSRARCSTVVSSKLRGLATQLTLVDCGRNSQEPDGVLDERVNNASIDKSGSTHDDKTNPHRCPVVTRRTPHYPAWRAAVIHAEEIGADVIFGSDHFHRPAMSGFADGWPVLTPEQRDVNNFEGWSAGVVGRNYPACRDRPAGHRRTQGRMHCDPHRPVLGVAVHLRFGRIHRDLLVVDPEGGPVRVGIGEAAG
jgi:hypothetical protein